MEESNLQCQYQEDQQYMSDPEEIQSKIFDHQQEVYDFEEIDVPFKLNQNQSYTDSKNFSTISNDLSVNYPRQMFFDAAFSIMNMNGVELDRSEYDFDIPLFIGTKEEFEVATTPFAYNVYLKNLADTCLAINNSDNQVKKPSPFVYRELYMIQGSQDQIQILSKALIKCQNVPSGSLNYKAKSGIKSAGLSKLNPPSQQVKYKNFERREEISMEMYYQTLYVKLLKERQLFLNDQLLMNDKNYFQQWFDYCSPINNPLINTKGQKLNYEQLFPDMIKQFNGKMIPIVSKAKLLPPKEKQSSNNNSNQNLLSSQRNSDHQKFITDKFRLQVLGKNKGATLSSNQAQKSTIQYLQDKGPRPQSKTSEWPQNFNRNRYSKEMEGSPVMIDHNTYNYSLKIQKYNNRDDGFASANKTEHSKKRSQFCENLEMIQKVVDNHRGNSLSKESMEQQKKMSQGAIITDSKNMMIQKRSQGWNNSESSYNGSTSTSIKQKSHCVGDANIQNYVQIKGNHRRENSKNRELIARQQAYGQEEKQHQHFSDQFTTKDSSKLPYINQQSNSASKKVFGSNPIQKPDFLNDQAYSGVLAHSNDISFITSDPAYSTNQFLSQGHKRNMKIASYEDKMELIQVRQPLINNRSPQINAKFIKTKQTRLHLQNSQI